MNCQEPKRRRLPIVLQSLGRLSLLDDGERDWYEESVKYINMSFPDWKDLKTTVMVPSAFPVSLQEASQGDITEKRVYDLLEEFGKAYQQPMFVVHSHQFVDLIEEKKKGFEDNIKKWNKGEHDFVIIHRDYGFLFLQVKSSKCEDGQAFKKAILQIDKDIESMKAFLSDCFIPTLPPENMERVLYNYPGFVVMPNCQPKKTSIDPRGVFMNDCKDKESFKKWWDDKVVTSNNRVMNEELYQALLVRFVALRCSSPTTSSQIDETHKQIVHFHTPQQLKCMLTAGAQQWWAGPAGSGKTVLLKRKVKELAREILEQEGSENILVVCFNKSLSVHLKKQFQDWWRMLTKDCRGSQPDQSPVHVYTYDSFINKVFTEILQLKDSSELYSGQKFDRRRYDVENYFKDHELLSPLEKYQHIFVDEGQDFHGEKWLNVLKKFHDQDPNNNNNNNDKNSNSSNNNRNYSNNNDNNNNNNDKNSSDSRYYFWVFFDSNQHVQPRDNESISWLSNPNVFRLTKVLRNTENIFVLAKTCYYGDDRNDIVLGHREVGMNVVYDDSLMSNRSNGIRVLVKHVTELKQKKVMLRDIVILTKTKADSLQNFHIPHCNAEYPDYGNDCVVIIDSIRRFKGLESKIVILYDPPYELDKNNVETSALLYTAISRCFCYLIIVSTVDGCKAIKERVEKMRYGGEDEADGRGINSEDWD